jgi:hypothetical protein
VAHTNADRDLFERSRPPAGRSQRSRPRSSLAGALRDAVEGEDACRAVVLEPRLLVAVEDVSDGVGAARKRGESEYEHDLVAAVLAYVPDEPLAVALDAEGGGSVAGLGLAPGAGARNLLGKRSLLKDAERCVDV